MKIEQKEGESAILESLKNYVAFVVDTAQGLMDQSNLKPAQKLLRGCEKFLKSAVPSNIIYK